MWILKTAVVVCCVMFSAFASAQIARLDPNNPAPRLGEEVQINISIENENLDHLKDKENKTPEEWDRLARNKVAGGTFRMMQVMMDTGYVTIGPFIFNMQSTRYETNKISLHVNAPLPDKITDGIWVRHVHSEGYHYLIIEQRIANQLKKAVGQDNTIALSNKDLVFAEFDREKFEAKGFQIISTSTSTENQKVDKDAAFGASSGYKISIYKFVKSDHFKKTVIIDKKMFSNVPSGATVPEIIIK